MRNYLDCEFIDNGSTIDLISIGIIAEDGRELYLQSSEFEPRSASPWVVENVIPHLVECPYAPRDPHRRDTYLLEGVLRQHLYGQCKHPLHGHTPYPHCPWRTRPQIRNEVQAFLNPAQHGRPSLYTWCGSYDHIALCQLFGPMMALPEGYPHCVHDLQCFLDDHDIKDSELPQQELGLHHALCDARWIRHLWQYVEETYKAK